MGNCADKVQIFDYANTLLIRGHFYDSNDQLIDPTSITYSVLRPDKTTVDVYSENDFEVTHPSIGYYILEYDTYGAGVYNYRIEGVYDDDIIAIEGYFEIKKSKIPIPTP